MTAMSVRQETNAVIIRRRKVWIEIEHRSLTIEAFISPPQEQSAVQPAISSAMEIRATPHGDAPAATNRTLPEEAL